MSDPLFPPSMPPGQDPASGDVPNTLDPGMGPLPPAPPGQVPECDLHALPTRHLAPTPEGAAPPVVPGWWP
jgi:hypothetical protein